MHVKKQAKRIERSVPGSGMLSEKLNMSWTGAPVQCVLSDTLAGGHAAKAHQQVVQQKEQTQVQSPPIEQTKKIKSRN